VNELERGRDVQERFGVAEEEVPPRDQALVEHVDDLLARFLIEVDEHVATEDRVDAADDPNAFVVHEVQVTKMAKLADRVDDVASIGSLDEVVASKLRGRRSKSGRAIDAAASGGDATT
jgi:hypothetical protein